MIFKTIETDLDKGKKLFFGVGTGRCGTMTLANALNAESDVIALHEGKFRILEKPSDQLLPYLTLQNYYAYRQPEMAYAVLKKARSDMPKICEKKNIRLLGDIAYNYAPFVRSLAELFPLAKIIFVYRDGRDFIRSAYISGEPDNAPVGWPDSDRQLTKLERYISLGRLRPTEAEPVSSEWETLSPVAKNAWLWATTNKLILDGLQYWSESQVLALKFEEFFDNPILHYQKLRAFLGIEAELPPEIPSIFSKTINARKSFSLEQWQSWSASVKSDFDRFACDMMSKLGYY